MKFWILGAVFWFAAIGLALWVTERAYAEEPNVFLPCNANTCKIDRDSPHLPPGFTVSGIIAFGPTVGCEEKCTTISMPGKNAHVYGNIFSVWCWVFGGIQCVWDDNIIPKDLYWKALEAAVNK